MWASGYYESRGRYETATLISAEGMVLSLYYAGKSAWSREWKEDRNE